MLTLFGFGSGSFCRCLRQRRHVPVDLLFLEHRPRAKRLYRQWQTGSPDRRVVQAVLRAVRLRNLGSRLE